MAASVVFILNARVARRDEGPEPAVAAGTP